MIAGSAFAVAELRALVHAEIVELCLAVPRLVVTIYVDDISLGATESTRRAAARTLRCGYEALQAAVTGRCGLPLDAAKLALVATSPAMLQAASRAVGAPHLARVPRAKYVAGVQRGRAQGTCERLRRTCRLRAPEKGQRKVVFAGAMPTLLYGAEVVGISPYHGQAVDSASGRCSWYWGPRRRRRPRVGTAG